MVEKVDSLNVVQCFPVVVLLVSYKLFSCNVLKIFFSIIFPQIYFLYFAFRTEIHWKFIACELWNREQNFSYPRSIFRASFLKTVISSIALE